MQGDYEYTHNDIIVYEKKLATLEAEKAELKREVERLKAQAHHWKTEFGAAASHRLDLQEEVERLRSQIEPSTNIKRFIRRQTLELLLGGAAGVSRHGGSRLCDEPAAYVEAVKFALSDARAEGLRMACDHVPDGHTRRNLRELADRLERGEGSA